MEKLIEIIEVCGEDLDRIQEVFPNKSRGQIKSKISNERRRKLPNLSLGESMRQKASIKKNAKKDYKKHLKAKYDECVEINQKESLENEI